jgi:hypothetical protein
MREILFKAKRLDNGECVDGFYCCIGPVGQEKHYIIPMYASAFYGIEVAPSTVCEWTGLIDRDGTKVFEGDRLFDPHEKRTFVVEYDPLEAGFTLESNDGRYVDFNRVPYSKIIGNIYDGEGDND